MAGSNRIKPSLKPYSTFDCHWPKCTSLFSFTTSFHYCFHERSFLTATTLQQRLHMMAIISRDLPLSERYKGHPSHNSFKFQRYRFGLRSRGWSTRTQESPFSCNKASLDGNRFSWFSKTYYDWVSPVVPTPKSFMTLGH